MGYIGSGPTRFNTADDLTVTDDAEIKGGLTVDTTTLVVDDANNRVGIGTSSPSYKLDVSSASNVVAKFNYSGGASGYVYADANIVSYGSSTSGANAINFYDSLNLIRLYTGGTERMRIDSAGRVTMPNQPYFAAEMNGSGAYDTISQGAAFPFNTAVHNVGSHFNTSNYRFTAPVTGKYLFTVSFITNDSTPNGRIQFFVNGSPDGNSIKWGISGSNSGGGGDTNSSAIIYLNANDYVDARSQSGSVVVYDDNHSSFTGMLLG